MLFSAEQTVKGFVPICSTESGIVMLVRESHKENAQSPMEVTESGMVTRVRNLQS